AAAAARAVQFPPQADPRDARDPEVARRRVSAVPQPTLDRTCYHVNLFPGFGGSEVYTRFFCNAFAELGWQVVLFVNRKADYWRQLDLRGARLIEVDGLADVLPQLPQERALVVEHSPEPGEAARRIREKHLYVGIAYQPVYERDPEQYHVYHALW